MEIVRVGMAGSLESSDLMVTIDKNDKKEIQIHLKSTVEQQFGAEIKKVVHQVINDFDIKQCIVRIEDKGALDCIIISRIRTALCRACDVNEFNWGNAYDQ